MPLTPKTYGRSNPAALLAYQTAAQLRLALGRAGFEPDYDFPTLHGDITASDEPFVTFGRCSVDVIRRFVLILQKASGSAAQGGSDGPQCPAAPGGPEAVSAGPEPVPGKPVPATGSDARPAGG
jgi:hypothetical protein